jgi:hypothetical protein
MMGVKKTEDLEIALMKQTIKGLLIAYSMSAALRTYWKGCRCRAINKIENDT